MLLSQGQRAQLRDYGFVSMQSEFDDLDLLRIAEDLGRPVPSKPGRSVISELRPTRSSSQQTETFSSVFGLGEFPFHTDTAHWPVPARFVILRDVGRRHDRPTFVLPLRMFLTVCDTKDLVASVWKTTGPMGSFLCSIVNFSNENPAVRYDPLCMHPVNQAATHVAKVLSAIRWKPIRFDWKAHMTLIIDNWRTLHGRGMSVVDDSESRCLQRVLIYKSDHLPLFPYVLAA
jgi:Taurine catabolism dioxygenase TauD, TfdA family